MVTRYAASLLAGTMLTVFASGCLFTPPEDRLAQIDGSYTRTMAQTVNSNTTPSNPLANLPAATLAEMAAAINALPATVIAQMTAAEVEALPLAVTQAVSPAQWANLTPTAMAALPTTVLATLPATALATLPIAVLETLPASVIATLPASVRAQIPATVSNANILAGTLCGAQELAQRTVSNVFSKYSCAAGLTFNGNETVLSLGVVPAGDAVVSLNNFNNYPFIAIVADQNGAPNPNACVGGNYYAARFTADGNTSYSAIIDQDGGVATMTFDFMVTCQAPKTETNCTDGWDNDGNFDTDCADPACVGTASCTNGACSAGARLNCGDTLVVGSTGNANATRSVQSYSCPYQGVAAKSPEFAYQFNPNISGEVTFTVSDYLDYPMLFVLDDNGSGCNPNNCITQNYYSTTFKAQAGHNYYLVVDGKSGSPLNYKVSVVCNAPTTETACGNDVDDDGDGLTDCYDSDCKNIAPCTDSKTTVASAALTCNTRLQHGDSSTAAGNANFNSYSCSRNLHLTGREMTYKLAPVTTATPMLITVNNPNAYSVIAVTQDTGSGCDAAQCVTEGFYNATFTAQPGVQYCVSVEGYSASSVSFDLSVVCSPPATEGTTVSNCNDGVDNDGNLQVDCSDPSCLSSCDQPNNCAAKATLTCGTTLLAGNTTSGTNQIKWYGCSPAQPALGHEYTYKFVANANEKVLFTVSNESNYALVAVVPDSGTCDPYYCANLQYYSTTANVVAGKTYYVIVDSPNAGTVSYNMSVVCNPPATETNCSDGIDNDGNFLIDCADPNCHC